MLDISRLRESRSVERHTASNGDATQWKVVQFGRTEISLCDWLHRGHASLLGSGGKRTQIVCTDSIQITNIQVIFKVDAHNGNTVTTVAIANSEALVATGGKNKSVRLWKFNGDQLDELLTIRDFPLELESLQFNDDASRLGILLHAASAMQVLDLARLRATFDKLSINW